MSKINKDTIEVIQVILDAMLMAADMVDKEEVMLTTEPYTPSDFGVISDIYLSSMFQGMVGKDVPIRVDGVLYKITRVRD